MKTDDLYTLSPQALSEAVALEVAGMSARTRAHVASITPPDEASREAYQGIVAAVVADHCAARVRRAGVLRQLRRMERGRAARRRKIRDGWEWVEEWPPGPRGALILRHNRGSVS